MKKIISYLLFVILFIVFIFLAWYKLGVFFCNRGNYYFELQAYEKAAVYYKKAVKINPKAWTAYLGLADTYKEEKKYPAAVQEYEKVLKINPSFSRAYEFLADIYYQQGNYQQAQEVLLKGQKENPEDNKIKDSLKSNCFAYFSDTLAKSTELFMSNKNQEAIAILDEVLKICPGNALAYYTLGYYYLFSQDYNNAEMNLNKSLEIDPQFYYSYKLLSDICLKRGNIEKAIFFAQKVIDLNNTDASAYHNLGLLLMLLERYSQALPYLQKALILASDNADYAYSLASVYRDNKMYNQAIEIYKKLSKLNNDYPNMHNDLADIYTILNDPYQALLEYRKEMQNCQVKIKHSPNDPVALNDYAYALNGVGQSKEAGQIAEKLIISYPKYRQAYITLSKIYQKTGRNDLAIENLEKAKKLSPGTNFIDNEIFIVRNNPAAGKTYAKEKDSIYLRNGRKIKGRIKREDADKVILEVWLGSTPGELTFYRDTIERIEKENEDL